jgi:hypothetical protein
MEEQFMENIENILKRVEQLNSLYISNFINIKYDSKHKITLNVIGADKKFQNVSYNIHEVDLILTGMEVILKRFI